MPHSSCLWDSLDAIVVINLDHRVDRWQQMQAHLSAQNVPMEKVHRLSAVHGIGLVGYGDKKWFARTKRPTTWAGRAGCALSHRNALKLMQEKKWQRILILEDDARFIKPIEGEAGAKLASCFHGDKPSAYFLGFTEPQAPIKEVIRLDAQSTLYSLGGCLCPHAYVVNTATSRALLAHLPQEDVDVWPWLLRHTAIDTWYSIHMSRWVEIFAVSPVWVEQEDSYSDIVCKSSGGTHAPQLIPTKKAWSDVLFSRPFNALCRQLKWLLRCVRGF